MQRAVLLRTREKLEELQRAVAQLEAQLSAAPAAHPRHRTSTEPPPWDLRSCTAVHAPACMRPPSASKCTWPAACRAMSIVGLPEAAVREAKDRVRAAIQCAQFEFPARAHHRQPRAGGPAQGRRPLRPADRARHPRRQRADPARRTCSDYEFLGELGLTGELRAIDGVLPAALAAAQGRAQADRAARQRRRSGAGARSRGQHRAHAAGSRAARCRAASTLPAAIALPTRAHARPGHVRRARPGACAARAGSRGRRRPPPAADRPARLRQDAAGRAPDRPAARSQRSRSAGSRGDRVGQRSRPGSRALARAAVSHRRTTPPARWRWSAAASQPRPGEISLAHNGVLFLDELPEWDRRALEVLREPLESGVVTISRAARQSEFPARFQLVAAMNPCPCGWAGDPSGRCRCNADSDPALSRQDFRAAARPHRPACRRAAPAAGGTAPRCARRRIQRARARAGRRRARDPACARGQAQRAADAGRNHGALPPAAARPGAAGTRDRRAAAVSARSMHRILRVARTIADLAGSEHIATAHLSEALGYRRSIAAWRSRLRDDPGCSRCVGFGVQRVPPSRSPESMMGIASTHPAEQR